MRLSSTAWTLVPCSEPRAQGQQILSQSLLETPGCGHEHEEVPEPSSASRLPAQPLPRPASDPSVPPARGRPRVLGEVSLWLLGRPTSSRTFCLKAPDHDPVCFLFNKAGKRQLLCVGSVLEAGPARCGHAHS